jgi:hypothetical protein
MDRRDSIALRDRGLEDRIMLKLMRSNPIAYAEIYGLLESLLTSMHLIPGEKLTRM